MESKVCSHFIPRLDLHVCWKYRVYLFSYRIKVGAYISALIYQIVYFLYNYLYTLFSSISVSFNNKRNFIRWWFFFCQETCILLYWKTLMRKDLFNVNFCNKGFLCGPSFLWNGAYMYVPIIYVMIQQNIIIPF